MKPTRNRLAFTTVDVLAIGANTFLAIMHFVFATTDGNLLIGAAFLASNLIVVGFAAADARGRIRRGTVLHFARMFYVQVFYGFYFMRVIRLSQLVWGGASLDPYFYDLEELIFGTQLAVLLPERFGHLRVLNEVMYFVYFAFYPLLCLPGWILFLQKRYRKAERALFTITAAFGFLYVWYTFFPVQGPKYFIDALRARWYSDLDGYVFAWIMRSIFARANLAGAAVPSSHVAISTISTILFGRYLRRALPFVIPIVCVLYVSTTYLYAHYAVDVLFGIMAVPLLLWWSRWLYRTVHDRIRTEGSGAAVR